jgi:hypothetical protein
MALALAFAVKSCQDLVLLSKEELKTILTSEEADRLRAELRRKKIELISAKALVGEWVDIEGRGPGLILEYKKVWSGGEKCLCHACATTFLGSWLAFSSAAHVSVLNCAFT